MISIIFGTDINKNLIAYDIESCGSILVGGITASGKSTFIQSVIDNLMKTHLPSKLAFLLIDIKRVEFHKYKGSKYLLNNPIYEMDSAISILEELCGKSDKNDAYTFVVIDTFSDFLSEDTRRFDQILEKLTKRNKTFIIMCDSRVRPNVFTGNILRLFPTKMYFAMPHRNGTELKKGEALLQVREATPIIVKTLTD